MKQKKTAHLFGYCGAQFGCSIRIRFICNLFSILVECFYNFFCAAAAAHLGVPISVYDCNTQCGQRVATIFVDVDSENVMTHSLRRWPSVEQLRNMFLKIVTSLNVIVSHIECVKHVLCVCYQITIDVYIHTIRDDYFISASFYGKNGVICNNKKRNATAKQNVSVEMEQSALSF